MAYDVFLFKYLNALQEKIKRSGKGQKPLGLETIEFIERVIHKR